MQLADFRAALELCEKVGADPEAGIDAAVLEALPWKKSTRRSSVVPASTTQAGSNLTVILEKIATLEAKNDAKNAQLLRMSAQMEKMATRDGR
jgi:hypothetical protein